MSKKNKKIKFDDTKYIREIEKAKLFTPEERTRLWNTKDEEKIATMEQLVEDAKLSVDLYHTKKGKDRLFNKELDKEREKKSEKEKKRKEYIKSVLSSWEEKTKDDIKTKRQPKLTKKMLQSYYDYDHESREKNGGSFRKQKRRKYITRKKRKL